jgi:hypothetical protein
MAAAGLGHAGALNRPLYRPLQTVLRNMVATDRFSARVFGALLGRKDILPIMGMPRPKW